MLLDARASTMHAEGCESDPRASNCVRDSSYPPARWLAGSPLARECGESSGVSRRRMDEGSRLEIARFYEG